MEDMEIEVYKSLLEVRVVMGVPRNVLFYTIGIFAAIFALTENLLMFICSTIKEELSNAEGLKSYGIRGINYTFLNKIEQSDNFIRGVKDLFGVVEI